MVISMCYGSSTECMLNIYMKNKFIKTASTAAETYKHVTCIYRDSGARMFNNISLEV